MPCQGKEEHAERVTLVIALTIGQGEISQEAAPNEYVKHPEEGRCDARETGVNSITRDSIEGILHVQREENAVMPIA